MNKAILQSEFEREGQKLAKSKASVEKKKPQIDEKNAIKTSFLETSEYILEQIKNATNATHANHAIEGEDYEFLIYNKETGTIRMQKSFEYQNKLYCPIVDKITQNNGVFLPTGVAEYGTTSDLVKDINNFLQKYVELPSFYEKFLPSLILFYWVYEVFPFVPYVQFVGRTGTGKSTAMEVFGSLCYKSINVTGSLTVASIFRVATAWKGTLLMDEFEKAGENAREVIAFLKAGVSDNLVLRVEGETKKEINAYIVKAPKLFTSENPISDAGLQSRTIVIKMEKNTRPLPLFKLPHYYEEAQELRNKLLLWRLRNLGKINLSDIEFGFEELKSFDRRVQQVITPIYYFSDDLVKKDILEFAREQEEETKRERRDSLHGTIFEAIWEIYQQEGIVPVKQIATKINPPNSKYPISEKKIGNVVRKILGFDIVRTGHENIRTLVLEKQEEKLQELCEYYGIENTAPPSKAGVASVATVAVVPEVSEEETIPF